MRALLDVNVLIALLDAEHLHHESARLWLRDNIRHGWATCPITQNGCLRIMAHPTYPNSLAASLVARRLHEATATSHHQFWPDQTSLLHPGVVDWNQVIGSKQITDVYLLALAVERQGRFVTFDVRIPPSVIPGANPQSFFVI